MSCGFPDSQHAATIPPSERLRTSPCRFCGQSIVWGLTANGRRAPFDPDTLRNHWITCPERGAARKAFPQSKAWPQTGGSRRIGGSNASRHSGVRDGRT